MPFHINYTGPAPVDTYFVLHQPRGNSFQFNEETRESDLETDSEATSSFRGRHMHGTRKLLPFGYKLGFFRITEEVQELGTLRNSRRKHPRLPAISVPVQTRKISLDDDDDMGTLDAVESEFAEYHAPVHAPNLLYCAPDQDTETGSALVRTLHPIYNAATSFWAWGPDGPVDQGSDPFLRTWRDWVETIAPAVR